MSNAEAVEAAALRVFSWFSGQEGALVAAASEPSSRMPARAFSAGSESAVSSGGVLPEDVVAVGVDTTDERIVVYTKAPAKLKADQDELREIAGSTPVVFRKARPFRVTGRSLPPPTMDGAAAVSTAASGCGRSIGVGSAREAGTLGCLVRDEAGDLYGLTCSHVSAGCGLLDPAMPIVAPGVLDVRATAVPPRTIGLHHRSLPMVSGDPTRAAANVDAALFRITDPGLVTSWQGGHFDTPSVVALPESKMRVEKVGRTTGLRDGIVDSRLIGTFFVTYDLTVFNGPDRVTKFKETVYFTSGYLVRSGRNRFAERGDSGSLVVAVDADGMRRSVGIVFAGFADGNCWIVPLETVLKGLGVTLVHGHGGPP